MIKAVVFDLDNTLFDFMKMKRMAIEAAVPAMIDAGLNMNSEEAFARIDTIYRELGMEYQQVFDKFLEESRGHINLKVLSSGIVAYRKAREAALIPYPHVYSTLIALTKLGVKIGVLSDAPGREAWLRLAYMNLLHHFDKVVTFDDTGERKPNPTGFRTILGQLGVEAAEALMVGDWAERDMVGAKSIGMKTAFAKYGDTSGNQNPESDYILNDISELVEIIRQENKN